MRSTDCPGPGTWRADVAIGPYGLCAVKIGPAKNPAPGLLLARDETVS